LKVTVRLYYEENNEDEYKAMKKEIEDTINGLKEKVKSSLNIELDYEVIF